MEDIYGLVNKLTIDDVKAIKGIGDAKATIVFAALEYAWQQKKEQLEKEQITKEEYDDWRYNYLTAEGR